MLRSSARRAPNVPVAPTMSTEFLGTGVPPIAAERFLCVLAAAICSLPLLKRCSAPLPVHRVAANI